MVPKKSDVGSTYPLLVFISFVFSWVFLFSFSSDTKISQLSYLLVVFLLQVFGDAHICLELGHVTLVLSASPRYLCMLYQPWTVDTKI
jgi:hypothetical protein